MINYLRYNGKDSRDYGIMIRSKQTYNAPKRNVDFISVPGRDGDLIIDNENHSNIKITYGLKLFSPTIDSTARNQNINLAESTRKLKNWLLADGSYCELTDSYDPDYFRLAVMTSDIAFATKDENIANFDVQFNCKPYKYRIDGKIKAETTSGQLSLYNCENYKSLPYIKLYGSGTLIFAVNNTNFYIDNVVDNVIVDSEMMNIYKIGSSVNFNQYAHFDKFPYLSPGNNVIIGGTNVTKIEVIPRWRCL